MNTTVDALSPAAALSQEWFDVVLSGAATVAQLRSNVAATELTLDAQIPEFFSLAEEPAEYRGKRSAFVWN